jgi:hypothetical protein
MYEMLGVVESKSIVFVSHCSAYHGMNFTRPCRVAFDDKKAHPGHDWLAFEVM